MFNRLIQSFENITTAILARFVKYDHNIDGSHRPWIDAQNYASFAAAVDACGPAGSNPCNLIISSNIPVASNKTVETHITLEPRNGGKLDIQTGVTVTMKGSVIAPPVKWIQLNGNGVINFQNRFMQYVIPQWWGAVGDGVTDDASAINAAIASVTGGIPVYVPAGNYLYSTTIALLNDTNIYGDGIIRTKFTRKTGATGICMDATGDADDIVLKDFELDCDFKGTDGIQLGITGAAWGKSGLMENVKITDCAGIGADLSLDGSIIKNLIIENADGGAVGTHQIRFAGSVCNVYGLKLKGETGTTANIEFTGNNVNIFGMFLNDPHLTKAIRFNGDNNVITGLNIVTEDNTKTYTQLVYFESGSQENTIRDVEIEKGATDTITNSVFDNELSNTITFHSSFDRYSQLDVNFIVNFGGGADIPISDTTLTTLVFDNKSSSYAFDFNGDYDVATGKFKPSRKGRYHLGAQIGFSDTLVDQERIELHIFETSLGPAAVSSRQMATSGTNGAQGLNTSLIVDADVGDEYYVVILHSMGSSKGLSAIEWDTFFYGYLIN